MKKFLSVFFLVLLVFSFYFTYFSHNAFAQNTDEFIFLEPIPGLDQSAPRAGLLETYLGQIYRLSIGAAGILAVMMIVVGGIRYVFSAISPSEKEAAKSMVRDAVVGLLIIISAWLILNTINPDLVNFSLTITPIEDISTAPLVTKHSVVTSLPDVIPVSEGERNMRKQLERMGIEINNKFPCNDTDGNPISFQDFKNTYGVGCTSVEGLPNDIVEELEDLGQICQVVITGGTEGGHKTHGVGKSVVDISSKTNCSENIENKQNATKGTNSNNERVISYTSRGKCVKYTLEDEGGSNEHWHISITSSC